MSDPVAPINPGVPPTRPREPIYNDVRDDYDDEFGADQTPLSIARRRVAIPAVAFIVIGMLGAAGVLVGTAFAISDFVNSPTLPRSVTKLLVLLGLCVVGYVLCLVVIVGGRCLKDLRRRGWALAAAYIVTGLSLAGPYGLPFYPFGIWALVLLSQPAICVQFGRPPDPVED